MAAKILDDFDNLKNPVPEKRTDFAYSSVSVHTRVAYKQRYDIIRKGWKPSKEQELGSSAGDLSTVGVRGKRRITERGGVGIEDLG